MSIVQAVYTKIVSDIKKWMQMSESQRLQLFRNAYFVFGRPFLEALTELESNYDDVIVKQEAQFIVVEIKKKKQMLFYKMSNPPIEIQCCCEVTWARKIGEKVNLICKHQAIYLLWKYCFTSDRFKRKHNPMDATDSLMEILSKIQQ